MNKLSKRVLHQIFSYITHVLVNLKFLKVLAVWDGPPYGMVDSNYLPADADLLKYTKS
jgi:hypothetical protein